MITSHAFAIGRGLIETIIVKMSRIGKCQSKFIGEVLLLMLSIPHRVNFLQLGRYGNMSEQSYRLNFSKTFDFMRFNIELVTQKGSGEYIIGFDPSYLPKSGKHTPGLGYFYSGVAGCYKRGLEIGGLSAIDLNQNTAYHLHCEQSPSSRRDKVTSNKSLVDHYAEYVIRQAPSAQELSKILVVDGYFAKKKFLDPVNEQTSFEIICRLRDDADLRYLVNRGKKTGRGRPKKYDGKVDTKSIDKRRIKLGYEDEQMRIYEGVVYSWGLKRKIKIAYCEFLNQAGEISTYKIFFSTSESRAGIEIYQYYRARFQMEFNYRDAKQYAGLENCQARNRDRLNYHFNASLTSINIAKGIIRNKQENHEEIVLSIHDIKVELYNYTLAQRIFSIYDIEPELNKNNGKLAEILNFGKIAA